MDQGGRVKDARRALDRTPNGGLIAQVGAHELRARVELGMAPPVEHAHLIARVEQVPRDLAAHEACAASDQTERSDVVGSYFHGGAA
jgi:hypothetical protein